MRLVAVLGVLLVAVFVNHVLNGGGEGDLNPVAQAAERTAHLPGGKIALEVSYTAPGRSTPIVGFGDGSFDTDSGRSELEMSIPEVGTLTAVGDARTVYLRSPIFAAELPPGKPWLAMEPFLGHSPDTAFGSSSAKSTLDMLSATGTEVERVDRQTVRGHPTTRYRATIELDQIGELMARQGESELAREYRELASKMPAIPVEAWVDDRGLARRIETVEEIPVPDSGASVTMEMKMELFGFDKQPRIDLPADDEALDMTPLMRAELGMLNGNSFRGLVAPSTAPPLSAAAFRRQGVAICRDLEREAKETGPPRVSLGDALSQAESKASFLATMRDWSQTYVRPGIALATRAARRLARLSPPASMGSEFTAAKRQLAIGLERLQALEVALETGSVRALKQLGAEEKAHQHDGEAELRKLGLGACVGQDGEATEQRGDRA